MQNDSRFNQDMDRIQRMQQELAEMTKLLGLPAPPFPALSPQEKQQEQHGLQQQPEEAVRGLAKQPACQQKLPIQQQKRKHAHAYAVGAVASTPVLLESVPSNGSSSTTVLAVAGGSPSTPPPPAVQGKAGPGVAADSIAVNLNPGSSCPAYPKQQDADLPQSSVPGSNQAAFIVQQLTGQHRYRRCAECGIDSNMCQLHWRRDPRDPQRVLCNACGLRAAAAVKTGAIPSPPAIVHRPPIRTYMRDGITELMQIRQQLKVKEVLPVPPVSTKLPKVATTSSSSGNVAAIHTPSSSQHTECTTHSATTLAAAAALASMRSTPEAADAKAAAAISAAAAAAAQLTELQYQPPKKRPRRRPADMPARQCANCQNTDSKNWRYDPVNVKRVLCNACGLYKVKYGNDRPLVLARYALQRNQEKQVAVAAAEGLLQSMVAGTQAPTVVPTAYMTAAQPATAATATAGPLYIPVVCHPLQLAAPMTHLSAVTQSAVQASAATVHNKSNSGSPLPVQYRLPAVASAAAAKIPDDIPAVLRPALAAAAAAMQLQEAAYPIEGYHEEDEAGEDAAVVVNIPAAAEPVTVDVHDNDTSDVSAAAATAVEAEPDETLEGVDVEAAAASAAAGVKQFLQRWVAVQQQA